MVHKYFTESFMDTADQELNWPAWIIDGPWLIQFILVGKHSTGLMLATKICGFWQPVELAVALLFLFFEVELFISYT